MAARVVPHKKHLMPVSFGPSPGPRQRPDGDAFEEGPSRITRHAIRFLSDAAALAALLPEGLTPWGEPIVTVEFTTLRDLPWLAGRGYNSLGVRIPGKFSGKRDTVTGQFLTVLWENLTDPILTGREQLGYPKIYAELSEPRVHRGTHQFRGSWLGFAFLDMTMTCAEELPEERRAEYMARSQYGDGTLLHKYIPRTGEPWTEADASYFTFTPVASTPNRVKAAKPPQITLGTGTVAFHRARWQDLPTQAHIVNALSDLPIREWRGAAIARALDFTDYNEQRVLA
jgi:hypothetical protein